MRKRALQQKTFAPNFKTYWNILSCLTISDRLAETEFLEGERADLPVFHYHDDHCKLEKNLS